MTTGISTSTADDEVHHQRGQTPASNGAHQIGLVIWHERVVTQCSCFDAAYLRDTAAVQLEWLTLGLAGRNLPVSKR